MTNAFTDPNEVNAVVTPLTMQKCGQNLTITYLLTTRYLLQQIPSLELILR